MLKELSGGDDNFPPVRATRARCIVMRLGSVGSLLLLASVVFLVGVPIVASDGATWTWNGDDADDDFWSSGDNWVEDTPPSDGSLTELIFAGSTRLTPEQDIDTAGATPVDFLFHSMIFSNNAGAFQLGGVTNLAGQDGFRLYKLAGSNPFITLQAGCSNILVKGVLVAKYNDLNQVVDIPSGHMLWVGWIYGGTGDRIVKTGAGTLRSYEHADGQRYARTASNVGPEYWVKDGTLEIGTRSDRYIWKGTHWTNDASQRKQYYDLDVGDGIGAATSAVVRIIDGSGVLGTGIRVHSDGWLDLNGFGGHPVQDITNNSGVISLGTATHSFKSTTLTLNGDALIEGTDSDSLWLYTTARIVVDDTETRATIASDAMLRTDGAGVGPTFFVADKPGDDIDLEVTGYLGIGGDAVNSHLQKFGEGTMSIMDMRYTTADQAVYEGTLLINGTCDGTTGGWIVSTNGILGGSGLITDGDILVDAGGINPGNPGSSGVFTVEQGVTFNPNSELVIDVAGGGAVAGTDYDQLVLQAGSLTGLGNIDLTVNVTGTPDVDGDVLRIIDGGGDYTGLSFRSTQIRGLRARSMIATYGDGYVEVTLVRTGSLLTVQ